MYFCNHFVFITLVPDVFTTNTHWPADTGLISLHPGSPWGPGPGSDIQREAHSLRLVPEVTQTTWGTRGLVRSVPPTSPQRKIKIDISAAVLCIQLDNVRHFKSRDFTVLRLELGSVCIRLK